MRRFGRARGVSHAGFVVIVFIVRRVDRREGRGAKAKGLIEVSRGLWDRPRDRLPGGAVLQRLNEGDLAVSNAKERLQRVRCGT